MKLKDSIRELGIKNNRRCIAKGNKRTSRSIYLCNIDYEPIISNWNKIYDSLAKKTIKRLEDYGDLSAFYNDINRIIEISFEHKHSPSSASYRYEYKNRDLFNQIKYNIFNKSIDSIKFDMEEGFQIKLVQSINKTLYNIPYHNRSEYFITIKKNNVEQIKELFKFANEFEHKEIKLFVDSGVFNGFASTSIRDIYSMLK